MATIVDVYKCVDSVYLGMYYLDTIRHVLLKIFFVNSYNRIMIFPFCFTCISLTKLYFLSVISFLLFVTGVIVITFCTNDVFFTNVGLS